MYEESYVLDGRIVNFEKIFCEIDVKVRKSI